MEQTKILIAVAAQYSRSRAFESFLKEAGYDVRVVTRNMANKFSFWNFFREIILWKPRIVHVINDPEFMVIPVILASKLVGAKIIYDKRANCSLERKEIRRDKYYYVERLAEIFGSPFYDVKITPLYRVHREREYLLIPQAVNLKKATSRHKKGDKYLIFTACGFSDTYGIDVLLRSLRYVTRKDLYLQIFGDDQGKPKFERLAKADSRIKFFGRLPYKEYIKYLLSADICIIPFNKMAPSGYASPYSVLKLGEFTFFNKPIVCADVGDMRLAEKNGVVFYEPGNPKDLAEKITGQIKNPKKTTFFEELDREKVKLKYLDIIRGLLQKQ